MTIYASLGHRTLDEVDEQSIAELYGNGHGSIHGFAYVFNVSISRIKAILDREGIGHKQGGNTNVWISPAEIEEYVRQKRTKRDRGEEWRTSSSSSSSSS